MRRPTVLLAALAVATTACTATAPSDERGTRRGDPRPVRIESVLASSLRSFEDCGELLSHLQDHGAAQRQALQDEWSSKVGPFRRDLAMGPLADPSPVAAEADGASRAATRTGGDEQAFSTTNVQERGVDEPDLVKTDGRHIFTVAGSRLWSFSAGEPAAVLDSIELPEGGPAEILLSGDRVLVLSGTSGPRLASRRPGAAPPIPSTSPPAGTSTLTREFAPGLTFETVTLTLVDVSNPATLSTVGTFEADGHVLAARQIGDVARVVVRTPMLVAFQALDSPVASPEGPLSGADPAGPLAGEALRATTLEDWLPSYRFSGPELGGSGSGLLSRCDQVVRPAEFSGLGALSVLTFELGRGLGSGEAVSVVADGEVVYASAESLYVATNRSSGASRGEAPSLEPQPQMTEIHKFDIRDAGPARHVASGSVRGQLLSQFSMSEHEGFLRLATTGEASAIPDRGASTVEGPRQAPSTESFVSVLADREGRLVKVGEVGGLGRGERIYAVRFLGPVGYVVTFRQTDPLYTLDLSDPARPTVVGELKIPGYSAYLHPVGEGLILGVGQNASEEGRRLGSQVSLFDVSDPARPLRLHQRSLGVGASEVEFDHHAFLWWSPSRLAVLPIQTFPSFEAPRDGTGGFSGNGGFSGAVGLGVDPQGGIRELGRLSHPVPGGASVEERKVALGGAPIRRSLVIGGSIYTISDAGILASDLDTLEPRGFVEFPG